jgi:Uma2 family endonuclease
VTQLPPETDFGLTFEDLADFETGEGFRTELLEGRFVVAPPPFLIHAIAATHLRDMLKAAVPSEMWVFEGVGVYIDEHNYFIPDIVVVPPESIDRDDKGFVPQDVILAVEVVSPSSRTYDNVTKRLAYAKAGIHTYWIVDPKAKSLLMLELADEVYVETSTQPLGLAVDPAEIFQR